MWFELNISFEINVSFDSDFSERRNTQYHSQSLVQDLKTYFENYEQQKLQRL